MLRRGGGRAAYGGRAGYGGRACGREGKRAGLEGGWVGRAGGRVRDMWRHALAALGEEEQEEVQVEEVDIKKLYRVTALRAHRAPPPCIPFVMRSAWISSSYPKAVSI